MRQLLEVFSAISPVYRHQLLTEARDQRSSSSSTKPSARSCSTCAYYMRGVKPNEPDTCNAFHSPTQNVCAVNDCPDWELKKR